MKTLKDYRKEITEDAMSKALTNPTKLAASVASKAKGKIIPFHTHINTANGPEHHFGHTDEFGVKHHSETHVGELGQHEIKSKMDDIYKTHAVKEDVELDEGDLPPMELHLKKGAFHRWLKKSEDEPITAEDIKRGLNSNDPHVVKMATFAKNARKWHHESVELDEMPISTKKVGDIGHIITWAGGKGKEKGTYFSKLHPTHKEFDATKMQRIEEELDEATFEPSLTDKTSGHYRAEKFAKPSRQHRGTYGTSHKADDEEEHKEPSPEKKAEFNTDSLAQALGMTPKKEPSRADLTRAEFKGAGRLVRHVVKEGLEYSIFKEGSIYRFEMLDEDKVVLEGRAATENGAFILANRKIDEAFKKVEQDLDKTTSDMDPTKVPLARTRKILNSIKKA